MSETQYQKYVKSRQDRRRARRRAKAQRQRHRRRERGLCPGCGERPPEVGYTRCQECRERQNASKRAREARRRAQGKCVDCDTPAESGCARCRKHLLINQERQLKYRLRVGPKSYPLTRKQRIEARIRAGVCRSCGKRKPKPGCKTCVYCLQANARTKNDTRAERIERGLCPACGKRALSNRWGCKRCVEKNRESMRSQRAKKKLEKLLGENKQCISPQPK